MRTWMWIVLGIAAAWMLGVFGEWQFGNWHNLNIGRELTQLANPRANHSMGTATIDLAGKTAKV